MGTDMRWSTTVVLMSGWLCDVPLGIEFDDGSALTASPSGARLGLRLVPLIPLVDCGLVRRVPLVQPPENHPCRTSTARLISKHAPHHCHHQSLPHVDDDETKICVQCLLLLVLAVTLVDVCR